MTDQAKPAEIEDVLSSIRRLVAGGTPVVGARVAGASQQDNAAKGVPDGEGQSLGDRPEDRAETPEDRPTAAQTGPSDDALVLTQSLRVAGEAHADTARKASDDDATSEAREAAEADRDGDEDGEGDAPDGLALQESSERVEYDFDPADEGPTLDTGDLDVVDAAAANDPDRAEEGDDLSAGEARRPRATTEDDGVAPMASDARGVTHEAAAGPNEPGANGEPAEAADPGSPDGPAAPEDGQTPRGAEVRSEPDVGAERSLTFAHRTSPFLPDSLVSKRLAERESPTPGSEGQPGTPEAPRAGFGFGVTRRDDPVRHVPLKPLAPATGAQGGQDGEPSRADDEVLRVAPDADPHYGDDGPTDEGATDDGPTDEGATEQQSDPAFLSSTSAGSHSAHGPLAEAEDTPVFSDAGTAEDIAVDEAGEDAAAEAVDPDEASQIAQDDGEPAERDLSGEAAELPPSDPEAGNAAVVDARDKETADPHDDEDVRHAEPAAGDEGPQREELPLSDTIDAATGATPPSAGEAALSPDASPAGDEMPLAIEGEVTADDDDPQLAAALDATEDDFLADDGADAGAALPATREGRSLEARRTPLAPSPPPRRLNVFGAEINPMNEEELRAIIADVVQRELQGKLGERVSHNIRQLVRREVSRALQERDLL